MASIKDVAREANVSVATVSRVINKRGTVTDETEKLVEEHNYFGYDKNYIRFFVQETAPCVDFNGKILLETKNIKETKLLDFDSHKKILAEQISELDNLKEQITR